MAPVLVPVPTTKLILSLECTVKDRALVPLTVTEVAPVKFVPVTTTRVPELPLAPTKEVIVGGTAATYSVGEVAIPFGASTRMYPVRVPAATTSVIFVLLATVNDAAGVPLTVTAPVPVKFVPVSVISVPAGVFATVKPVMVGVGSGGGAFVTVKLVGPLPGPPCTVVTTTAPVPAPAGTTERIPVAVCWNTAGTPPKVTVLAR